jgi:hypothetical protein
MGKKQNSNKQAKRLKKEKATAEQAEAIIADAIDAVKAKPKASDDKWASERKEGVSDEDYVLGCRVRELRDQGEPWWAIANALELEGAGSSATTGKKGAARARQAYAKAFGSHPRTFTRGQGNSRTRFETNDHVKKMKMEKVSDLKKRAKNGKSVISPKMPDAEVAAMLKGRTIKWFSTELIPEGMDYEASIHPRTPLYIMGEGKHRIIEFREEHRRAPLKDRWHPGKIRTVRLRQIYQVK